jgi:hypothetical protein
MIEPLSRSVRDYLAQFGVAAVYVTASGEVGTTSPGEFSLLPVKAAWRPAIPLWSPRLWRQARAERSARQRGHFREKLSFPHPVPE